MIIKFSNMFGVKNAKGFCPTLWMPMYRISRALTMIWSQRKYLTLQGISTASDDSSKPHAFPEFIIVGLPQLLWQNVPQLTIFSEFLWFLAKFFNKIHSDCTSRCLVIKHGCSDKDHYKTIFTFMALLVLKIHFIPAFGFHQTTWSLTFTAKIIMIFITFDNSLEMSWALHRSTDPFSRVIHCRHRKQNCCLIHWDQINRNT